MPGKTRSKPEGRGSKRVHLQYPDNWDELTEEQKQEVGYEMARILQRELGHIQPK